MKKPDRALNGPRRAGPEPLRQPVCPLGCPHTIVIHQFIILNYPSRYCLDLITDSSSNMHDLQKLLDRVTSQGSSAACWLESEVKEYVCASGKVEGKNLDPDATIFSAASISKLVIGAAVMQCVEEDLMKLEDNICSYLPISCPCINPFFEVEIITVEMLLTHKSSLCDTEDQLKKGSKYRLDGGTQMKMSLEEYARDFVVGNTSIWSRVSPPGSTIAYSNAGFTILGLAIETARKQPLQQVVQERIFAPLSMTRSFFFLNEALAASGCVVAPPGGRHFYEVAEWPAAQLRSTAPDILRFLRCFTLRGPANGGPNILGPTSIARMQPAGGTGGLAWWGSDFPYSQRIGAWEHGGFMEGIRSHAYVWAHGAVVLLFNAEDNYETSAASLVRDLIAAGPVPPFAKTKSR